MGGSLHLPESRFTSTCQKAVSHETAAQLTEPSPGGIKPTSPTDDGVPSSKRRFVICDCRLLITERTCSARGEALPRAPPRAMAVAVRALSTRCHTRAHHLGINMLALREW